ncbi:haloacid dehalogenase type II [Mycobacterium sp.]|uniref:haloacid dehalogenase type II n=1 Tax=Mycobacterium sp. TaxID=1785 RepID=UPI003BA90329
MRPLSDEPVQEEPFLVHRPQTVAFDVVETLMNLEPMRGHLAEIGVPGSALEHWYDRTLRDGMALTLTGDYKPFSAAAESALRIIGGDRLSDGDVERVLDGFATLPAQPDAEPAMAALANAGLSIVCLTNGARETTEAFLNRNGLDRFVEQVLSVTAVGTWKPHPAVYEYALSKTRLPAHDVALIAVHAFDCHGANAAGLTTGWSARLEKHYSEIFTRADVIGDNLVDVAGKLLDLPARAPVPPT